MPTLAFTLVLFSATLHAYWNFIAKKQARNPAVFFMGLGFALLALAIPAAFALTTMSALLQTLPYMAATGVLHAGYYTFLFKGYAQQDLSSMYPLARGIGIVGVTAATVVLFHANIPPLGLAALMLVVLGVIALGVSEHASPPRRKLGTTTMFMPLIIGATITGYTLLDNEGVKAISPIVYATGLTMFTLLFLLPLRLWRGGQLQEAWRNYKKSSLIVGLGSIGTYLIILFVYQLTQLSFVVALREVSVAIGTVIGVIVLKETWNYTKIIAIALIVLGAILLRLV